MYVCVHVICVMYVCATHVMYVVTVDRCLKKRDLFFNSIGVLLYILILCLHYHYYVYVYYL